MALDFSLELETSLEPFEISKMITKLKGFYEDKDDSRYFWADGIYGGVRTLEGISQEVLEEEVGVRANRRIWYRLNTGENVYEQGQRNGLQAFMTVLQGTDGDAVIRLNGDDVKLIRKNGKVILNSKSFFDDEEAIWRIKDVPLADFEVKELDWDGKVVT